MFICVSGGCRCAPSAKTDFGEAAEFRGAVCTVCKICKEDDDQKKVFIIAGNNREGRRVAKVHTTLLFSTSSLNYAYKVNPRSGKSWLRL